MERLHQVCIAVMDMLMGPENILSYSMEDGVGAVEYRGICQRILERTTDDEVVVRRHHRWFSTNAA